MKLESTSSIKPKDTSSVRASAQSTGGSVLARFTSKPRRTKRGRTSEPSAMESLSFTLAKTPTRIFSSENEIKLQKFAVKELPCKGPSHPWPRDKTAAPWCLGQPRRGYAGVPASSGRPPPVISLADYFAGFEEYCGLLEFFKPTIQARLILNFSGSAWENEDSWDGIDVPVTNQGSSDGLLPSLQLPQLFLLVNVRF